MRIISLKKGRGGGASQGMMTHEDIRYCTVLNQDQPEVGMVESCNKTHDQCAKQRILSFLRVPVQPGQVSGESGLAHVDLKHHLRTVVYDRRTGRHILYNELPEQLL